MRCDFCGMLRPRWAYPVAGGTRKACDECCDAIEAGDREALLKRSLFMPVPRTVSDRYTPRFREAARQLQIDFWERSGPAQAL